MHPPRYQRSTGPARTRTELTSGQPTTPTIRELLEFEARRWTTPGAKEHAIRETFGMSAIRYYQQLNHSLDDPTALTLNPLLVGRLRRLRQQRTGR